MRFSVFALSSVPDVVTARRNLALDDLDDKAVAKVLFHQRKQRTGSSENLRWDERMLASVSIIHHSIDNVQIVTHDFASDDEPAMLRAYYTSALRSGCMVSWNPDALDLPLVHFRSLLHRVSYPAYWDAINERSDFHLSIVDRLAPGGSDLPSLDSIARKVGFPGMLGRGEDAVYEGWLRRDSTDAVAASDLAALNSYLLALRVFSLTGQVTRHDVERVEVRLRGDLSARKAGHFTDFLRAWERA
ncbi:MAG: hypothetical protein KDJ39_10300 [Gammaproteobacteria bacterium]|nr:hypothetical protein [Gammaproteobacteria bacterium]